MATKGSFVLKGRVNNAPVGSKRLYEKLSRMTLLRKEPRSTENDEWEMSILPFQISKLPSRDFSEMALEEQIAFKLLMVNLLDITSQNFEKRLRSIAEIYLWMNNDARRGDPPSDEGFEYRFSYWTEMLGVDEGYMKRKLKPFLIKATKAAKIGTLA